MKPDKRKKGRSSWPPVRPWAKVVKWVTKRKNRAATREKLHREDYDAMHPNKQVKTEDPWGYD